MKKILVLGAILTLFTACGKSETKVTITNPGVPNIVPAEEYILNSKGLGGNNEDVYMVFRNSNLYNFSRNTKETITITPFTSSLKNLNTSFYEEKLEDKELNPRFLLQKKLDERIEGIELKSANERSINYSQQYNFLEEGMTRNYEIEINNGKSFITTNKIHTLKRRVFDSVENRTLNLWVENNILNNYSDKEYDEISGYFLNPNDLNDIYRLVTNILGKEWYEQGETLKYINLLKGDNEINLILADLNTDYSKGKGRLLGYFDISNTIVAEVDTNNGLNIYVDAYGFREKDALGNYVSRDEAISTIAHEFVHLVNWYQKGLKHTIPSNPSNFMDPWLNELVAMMMEDILAFNLNIKGPRGVKDINVSEVDGTRLGVFNFYNDSEFNPYSMNNGINYSANYAFGAFLLRTYTDDGSLDFVRQIVHNDLKDEKAIIKAIETITSQSNTTFEYLVDNWAKAILLSNYNPEGETAYEYNVKRELNYGGINYILGPINILNHKKYSFKYYDVKQNSQTGIVLKGAANQYFYLGKLNEENKTWEISVPSGIEYQIIVKDSTGTYNQELSQRVFNNIEKKI